MLSLVSAGSKRTRENARVARDAEDTRREECAETWLLNLQSKLLLFKPGKIAVKRIALV